MIRKPYVPRPYYDLAADFMLSNPRCALWAGMGMGKTSITYSVLKALYDTGSLTRPTLVFGPLRVARDTWSTEVLKWEHLRGLDTSFVGGTPKERAQALKRDVPIFTCNYEQAVWLLDTLEAEDRLGFFQCVVSDESTRLKGYRTKQGSKRAQALSKLAKHADYWYNLTGTPAPNRLPDLWGQTWFLDFGARLGTSFEAFKNRWFYYPPDSSGDYRAPLAAHGFAEEQIHGLLRDICLTLDPKDWFKLDEPVVTTIRVNLPPAARKVYQQLEKEMFAQLEQGVTVEAFNAAALTNKCLQLANGAIYHQDPKDPTKRLGWQAVHDEKLAALESVLEESSTPPLIAYQFQSDRDRILKAFPGVVDLSTKQGMADYYAGKARAGVAHPKSMGHGIDGLQNVTNVLVRFGHDWAAEERLQMLERIGPVRQMQSGHSRPVLVYDIIADDTLDDTVIERHHSKIAVQDALLHAMKRNRR